MTETQTEPTPQAYTPKRGKCRNCGKDRLIVSEEWHTCQICTDAIKAGEIPIPEAKRPGRKPGSIPQKEPPKDPPKEPETSTSQNQEIEYLCDVCRRPVTPGQAKCRCGAYPDWRDTPIQDDPDILVCPRCGAIVSAGSDRCPHCSYSG